MEITLNKDISISIGEKNAFLSWKKQITLKPQVKEGRLHLPNKYSSKCKSIGVGVTMVMHPRIILICLAKPLHGHNYMTEQNGPSKRA